jgi:hypothetical protein
MRRAVWALGVLAGCVGCGGESTFEDGDDAVESCDEFSPCGGNIVGSWDIVESCIDEAGVAPVEDCPNSTYRYSQYDVDGGYVFDTNGGVTATFDIRFAYVWNLPRSCVGDLTCMEIEQTLNMATTPDASVVFHASCPEAPSECRCDVSGSITGTNSLTYTTSGSTLTLVTSDSESTQQYCVDGDDLTMRAEGGGFVLTRN